MICPHCGYNLEPDKLIERDGWTLDPRGKARWHGRPVAIQRRQALVMHTIASNAPRVVTVDVLLERHGDPDLDGALEYPRQWIYTLRKRLAQLGIASPILAERGRGMRGYYWDA